MDISYTTLQLFMKQKNNSIIKKNYLNLLQQLTNAENIEDNIFNKTIEDIHKHGVIYIAYNNNNEIIGSCSALIEQKIIHGCKNVCHIEDLVIDENYRNNGISKQLVSLCQNFAMDKNCYKIILNCKNELQPFYEKINFKNNGIQMSKYI